MLIRAMSASPPHSIMPPSISTRLILDVLLRVRAGRSWSYNIQYLPIASVFHHHYGEAIGIVIVHRQEKRHQARITGDAFVEFYDASYTYSPPGSRFPEWSVHCWLPPGVAGICLEWAKFESPAVLPLSSR